MKIRMTAIAIAMLAMIGSTWAASAIANNTNGLSTVAQRSQSFEGINDRRQPPPPPKPKS